MVSVLEVTQDGLTTKKSVTKSALLRISKIHTRDLLSLFAFERKRASPDLMVRDSAVIICFSHIRAIIQHDRLFLLNPESDFVRSFVPQLITHLETPPKQIKLCDPYEYEEHEKVDFELRALEAVLRFVCQTYRNRAMLITPLVDGLTARLSRQSDLSHDLLHQLLPMRDHLSEFEIELDTAENVLGNLLKNDEDLVGLLLTERKRLSGQLPPLEAHRSVELMLENYTSQLVDISNEAYFLRKRVESIQSVAELNYGSQRNRLLLVSQKLSMASISLASMTTVAGFFGMNMPNGLEQQPVGVFAGVVGGSMAMALAVFWALRAASVAPPIASNDYESVFQHLDEIQTVLGNGEFVRKQSFQHAMRALNVSEEVADLLWENRRLNPVLLDKCGGGGGNPELQRLFENTFIQREQSFKEERGRV